MPTDSASPDGPGVRSFTTPNGKWRVETRKLPILKAEPIEALHAKINIPIPEMIFGDNYVSLEHIPSDVRLEFNAGDALDLVSKTQDGMLQVAYSEEWKRNRQHQEGIKEVVKPFDWSYSTDYKGTSNKSDTWRPSDPKIHPIRLDLLSLPDQILFYDDVMLYEDELADNGEVMLSVKIRVMPERLLVLSRMFLRLDDVILRVRDTRVYLEFSTGLVVRQYISREGKYVDVVRKMKAKGIGLGGGGDGSGVVEALRDAGVVAGMLDVKDEVVDIWQT